MTCSRSDLVGARSARPSPPPRVASSTASAVDERASAMTCLHSTTVGARSGRPPPPRRAASPTASALSAPETDAPSSPVECRRWSRWAIAEGCPQPPVPEGRRLRPSSRSHRVVEGCGPLRRRRRHLCRSDVRLPALSVPCEGSLRRGGAARETCRCRIRTSGHRRRRRHRWAPSLPLGVVAFVAVPRAKQTTVPLAPRASFCIFSRMFATGGAAAAPGSASLPQ